MSIAIRQSKLTKGRIRLSLDIYHKGKTKYETLDLFLYDKPQSQQDREHNRRNMAIAEAIKAKRILELQENRYNVFTGFKSQGSLIQFFKRIMTEKSRREGKGSWYCAYRAFIKFFGEGDMTFEQCTPEFVKQYKEFLLTCPTFISGKRKLTLNSAVTYFEKFKSMLHMACEDKILLEHPGRGITITKHESQRTYLTLEEVRALSDTECECDLVKRGFLFCCLTGLRWSDMYKLTWKEVVYSEQEKIHKLLYRQKKTSVIQYHPIPDQAVKLMGPRKDDERRVFKGLEYSVMTNSKLKLWSINAGILNKHVTWHSSRHTYATLMLTEGIDIFTVSKLLGHRDVTTTQIYAKVIDKKKNEAVNSLPILI